MPELSPNGIHTVTPGSKLSKTMMCLEEYGVVKESTRGWTAHCPLCDTAEKVGIAIGQKRPFVMRCAKCEADYKALLGALGIPFGSLEEMPSENGTRPKVKETRERNGIHTEYLICDVDGNEVLIHHRKDYNDGRAKRIWWSMPDGSTDLSDAPALCDIPLFGMENLHKVEVGCKVVITEGEKAALALRRRHFPAMGAVGGSGTPPSEEVMKQFKGRKVILWPDEDDKGQQWTAKLSATCHSLGIPVYVYRWQDAPTDKVDGPDAADHPAIVSGNPEKLKALFLEVGNAEQVDAPYDMRKGGLAPTRVFASEAKTLVDDIIDNQGVLGWSTGLGELDVLIRGLVKEELTVVAAHSGQGKTLFLGQMAAECARQGARVAFFSSETGIKSILVRLACAMSGVWYFGLKSADDEQRHLVKSQIDRIKSDLDISWDAYNSMNPAHIERQVERAQPEVVFVDYLQHLMPSSRGPREGHEKVAQMMRELTMLTGYDVPVIVSSQFTKEAQNRVDKDGNPSRPTKGDLMGSSGIGNDASNVVILHQPDRFNDDVPWPQKTVEVIVDKSRHGEQGVVKCRFLQGQQWLVPAPKPPVWYD